MVAAVWHSKMLPKLKGMIEAEQARKEEIERKERLHQRFLEFARIYMSRGVPESVPEEEPFMVPSYGIFKSDLRVLALLMEDDCRIPFTEERYDQIEDLIAKGAIKYNIHARQDLARMHGLYVFITGDEEETDEHIIKPFLARASTVFHLDCSAAPSCMSYRTLTEIFHLSFVCWVPEIGDPPPWRVFIQDITPDILAGKITRELLRVAGVSETSTWEQMERVCGENLVCTCRKPHFQQPVEITTLVSSIAWDFFALVDEDLNFRLADQTYSARTHLGKPVGRRKVEGRGSRRRIVRRFYRLPFRLDKLTPWARL